MVTITTRDTHRLATCLEGVVRGCASLGHGGAAGARGLTWDFPPAPSTARVTERAQQMTWILKKEPKKLLQPSAIISCGDRWSQNWG